ncbi:flagellar basal body P-ring formation chaperone FlgA [Thiohalophilus sp.]|uniref:flagellar basal body P-ring formation chaperone FlgA n=1 Tax=Thiohalophilus sp. TaxID=3028392 RepID=UPI002ACDCD1F|nr:flagellar basal body P-ring formation chaperone FlgA [Thiohalophilus sp.]MDZ7802611.1 flagellar basal body P-ring formation chaperone FlgA [Thiohalophilus sp.]
MIFRFLTTLRAPRLQRPATAPPRQVTAGAAARAGFVALMLLLLSGLNTSGWAASSDSAAIRQAVEAYLQEQFGPPGKDLDYTINQLDPRLRLAACDEPLRVGFPPGGRQSGYTTLITECRGRNGWKIHVPVSIRRFAEVLVAVRNLPRGTRLSSDDVRAERREISRLNRGYYRRPAEIAGQVLQRSVRQARVLNPASVARPRLVRRGDEITIIARAGNLTIHVKGKALMDGTEGKKIRVRNLRSKEELQATVVGPGKVKVTI